MKFISHLLTALSLMCSTALAAQGELIINSMHSDPTSKKAFESILEVFKKEQSGIKVTVNTIDHESYKVQIRTWLPNNPPDVATWFAGNRAKFFVEKKLIEPIDDVFSKAKGQFSEGALSAVTFDGKKYLMPTNYYHWGFYYRKDLFAKAGIKQPPNTWSELLEASKALKKANISPVAIGTKQAWPAAAWFDFINMGVNGYTFHMNLLSGKESYTSEKVKNAMKVWGQLVATSAFSRHGICDDVARGIGLTVAGQSGHVSDGQFHCLRNSSHCEKRNWLFSISDH